VETLTILGQYLTIQGDYSFKVYISVYDNKGNGETFSTGVHYFSVNK
jgi:hypothetical protein